MTLHAFAGIFRTTSFFSLICCVLHLPPGVALLSISYISLISSISSSLYHPFTNFISSNSNLFPRISEGLGVGVAFSGARGMTSGPFITWAIALHNIPEGLAVCLVLIPKGESKLRAALYAIFTSLPQPLVAVPAFYFVDSVKMLQPIGMGASAGTMIWMVFSEMIPEASKNISNDAVGLVVTIAVCAMSTFNVILGQLE